MAMLNIKQTLRITALDIQLGSIVIAITPRRVVAVIVATVVQKHA